MYWIGVTDIAVQGDWIFASDSSYVNSSYWHSTEPSGKPLENCVVMRDTFMGYWDDVLCSTEAGFVCEKIDTCECLVQHVGFHCYCIEGPSIIVFYCPSRESFSQFFFYKNSKALQIKYKKVIY